MSRYPTFAQFRDLDSMHGVGIAGDADDMSDMSQFDIPGLSDPIPGVPGFDGDAFARHAAFGSAYGAAMPSALPASTGVNGAAAPFYVYDLLASESLARWGADSPVGTPVTITYGFPTTEPSSIAYPNFTAFTATEAAAARDALAYIGSLTKITFVETSSGNAELQFGNGDLTAFGSGVSGRANYSYTNAGIQDATVVLSNTGPASLAGSDFVPGSITSNDIGGKGWGTLLHEIGHALGFKHPFEQNIANDPNSILPANLDDLAHTVMSYTAYQPSNVAIVTGTASSYSYQSSNLDPQTYSLYDIAALQYLYGAPTASSGNHVYSFSPTSPIIETIYDNGPNDTIDCSALTGACRVDLTPGAMSDLAISQALPFGITIPDQYDGSSALTIAYGCLIANCVGGSGGDQIIGNAIANVLTGGGGVDTMTGGGGNDTYYVDNTADRVNEAAGGGSDLVWTSVSYALAAGQEVEKVYALAPNGTAAINLTGNVYFNTLAGTAGVNVLNGGYGADVTIGLGGNDTYYVDNAADQVIEAVGGGADVVRASVSFTLTAGQEIEFLTTTSNAGTAAINLTGNAFANTIYGNAGANALNGGAGADTLAGFGGNDIYYVDNAADHVFEAAGGGADLVWTSVSYALAAGQEVEKLYTLSPGGTAAINLTGNAFANTLAGNAGANVLNGAGGADVMIGGAGNDSYYVDAAADQVIEAAGGGADVVRTSLSFALTAGQEIETLVTTNNAGTGAINLTGNAGNNTIYGNAGANVLNGGLGADALVGFGGHDTFVFSTTLGGGNIDHVYDFALSTAADPDTIQLAHAVFTTLPTGALATAAFVDLASAAETASSRILYNHNSGALFYDADGAGGTAAVQFAVVDNHAALTHSDFFVA